MDWSDDFDARLNAAARRLAVTHALERAKEATPQQRIASGAAGAGVGWVDQWDRRTDDYGYRRAGKQGPVELPQRTRDQARIDSVAGYRTNPMARAIIDTYVAFCVGDSGVTLNCSNEQVRMVAEAFWKDIRNRFGDQEIIARSWLIQGEALHEMMVGKLTGVTRRSVIDPARIVGIDLDRGNPLWPAAVRLRTGQPGEEIVRSIAAIDDLTGLRSGECIYWPGFRTLETDTRGAPFLLPVLDWLDSYDQVLSNLIDRTAVARYVALHYQLEGASEPEIQDFITKRGGTHLPAAGTAEVTNEKVSISPITATPGAYEDAKTNQAVLTSVSAGAGLSKTWLAEPEDANRATSLTMAEPVRRRIGSVQNELMANLTEMVRFSVDQAVAALRIPMLVDVETPSGPVAMPAADTVTITGPSVAAADAKVTAEVLHKLALSLKELRGLGLMSEEAGRVAVRKAWEQFVGVPYRPELDAKVSEHGDTDALAEHIDTHGGQLPATA